MRPYLSIMRAAILLIPFQVNAQTQSLSLLQAQDYAAKNSYSVKNAEHDQESAEYTTRELLGIGLPQLSASAQYQNYLDLPTSIVPGDFFGRPGEEARLQFGVPHNMTVGLSASQLIFDGTWLVGLEASRAYAELQRKQINKSLRDVRNDVAKAYHRAVLTKANVVFLTEQRDNTRKLLNETEELYKSGFREKLDVDQLMLTLNEIEIQTQYNQQYIAITENILKFTIGMPVSAPLELTDTWESLAMSADVSAFTFTPESSMDVQLVQHALLMQELNVKSKKAAYLPNAAAFYNLQTQGLRQEFNYFDAGKPWFPIQLWGIQLNIPILSGGSRNSTVKKTEVEVHRMQDMLTMTKESVQLEHNTAFSEYEFAGRRMNQSKASLELAKRILETTEIKYREGLANSLEITQNNQQLISAQSNYVASILALMDAKSNLLKTLNQ